MRTIWMLILCSNCALANVDEAEPRVCPGLAVVSAEDLRQTRECEEIEGDLVLRSPVLERIDLPRLRRVSGSLISIGSRPLREIELPSLREVGTSGQEDLLEIGFDADTLVRIAMPELRVVHGSLGIVALGGLRELDLSSLEHVEERLGLINLPQLQTLLLADDLAADGGSWFELLCQLEPEQLPGSVGPERHVRDCE
jgi:hypothetical protein